jgi:hypothetical protein
MSIASRPDRREVSTRFGDDRLEGAEPGSLEGSFVPVPTVPLRNVLGRVGEELERLAGLLDRFETRVGPLLPEVVGHDPRLVQQVQCLDEIGQSLNGLVAFLVALVPDTASQWHLDPGPAAGVVKLADLAARLGFRDAMEQPASVDPGDCELL